MKTTTRMLSVGVLGLFGAWSAGTALAQAPDARSLNGSELVGQSTSPTPRDSMAPDAQVQNSARVAARGGATELYGQSTAAPMLASSRMREEAYSDAVAASHASGTELIGQSTAPPRTNGSAR